MSEQRNIKGLDLGTSRIVVARPRQENRFEFSTQLNAFVALPHSKVTESMLERERILFSIEDGEILAYGNKVEKFANLLGGETRRPMQTGLLNPREPKSLHMTELALRHLCGPAQPGEKICFSVPAAPPTNQQDLIYHERTVTQMLEQLGYQVKSLNEGLAVVYAELENDSFTGIGISFGGGMCNVCLAYLGMPAISFSTVRAGDYIDRSAASVSGESPTAVRLYKENGFALNGRSGNGVDQALSVYYMEVIQHVVDGLAKTLGETNKLPRLDASIPVVIGGGTALARGFREELEKALRQRALALKISEVRLASEPLDTTAKGAAMAAVLDM